MSIELKIKSKHLGEEARVIRHEEQKLKKQAAWLRDKQGTIERTPVEGKSWYNWPLTPLGVTYEKLRCISEHRKWDVRNENRATFLARAFIAGKAYRSVEGPGTDDDKLFAHIVPRLVKLIQKYHPEGNKISRDMVVAWIRAE